MEYLLASLQYLWSQIWSILKPGQPLSWRTLMTLCIFSWMLALITSDAQWLGEMGGNVNINDVSDPFPSFLWFQMSFTRWVLFTMGWVFLCLSIAWLLSSTKIVLPFFKIAIAPGVWIVGFLTSAYLFLIGPQDFRTVAIVAWPIISAIYTLLPKIITSTGKLQTPPPKIRQQFVIIFLASATISCWLQFSVLVQKWVTDYPVLLLAPLEQSTFITPLGNTSAVALVAEESLDQTLQLLPIPEVRQWIKNVDDYSEAVNDRFQSKLDSSSNQSSGLNFNRILQRVQNQSGASDRQSNSDTNDNNNQSDERSDELTEQILSQIQDQPTNLENRAIEIWKMTLKADSEDPLALRLQLRLAQNNTSQSEQSVLSLESETEPKSLDEHDVYIEYLCQVEDYTAQSHSSDHLPDNLSENTSDSPPNHSELAPNPISDVVPATPNNIEQYRQNSLDCNFIGMYKRKLT